MNRSRSICAFAIIACALSLAACGDRQQSVRPTTHFDQNLTNAARNISSLQYAVLPPGVQGVQCWAEEHTLVPRRVRAFCNVTFTGRAVSDIGKAAIGWKMEVAEPYGSDDSDSDTPYLYVPESNPRLLAETGFVFEATNGPQGVSIAVSADENRVTLPQAQGFVVAVLEAVSKDMSTSLDEARDRAPDTIRSTWSKRS